MSKIRYFLISSLFIIIFLCGCTSPDKRKRYVSFSYQDKEYATSSIFSHNQYVVLRGLIFDLENNVSYATDESSSSDIIACDDNYFYCNMRARNEEGSYLRNDIFKKIDYKGNFIQQIELSRCGFVGTYENQLFFYDNYEKELFCFEGNNFDEPRYILSSEQETAFRESQLGIYSPNRHNQFAEKYGEFTYEVNSPHYYQPLNRTYDWREMGVSQIYRTSESEEKDLIYETPPACYVLFFDDEKIITYSDNKIIKTYYNEGESNTIMTVDWDNYSDDIKIQYIIYLGRFGFSVSSYIWNIGDVIYSAAYDKIFHPADIPLAEA